MGSDSGTCGELAPCTLQRATDLGGFDEEVIVEPGTYFASSQIDVDLRKNVHGRAGAPRPRLMSSASVAVDVEGGATLRDFEVHHTGGAVGLSVSGSVDRVFVESASHACSFGGGDAAILNSVCWSKGQLTSGVAFAIVAGPGFPVFAATLRNVTVFAQFGYGISVEASGNARLVINATNVSTFGAQEDVRTIESGTAGEVSATVNLVHSIFQSVDVFDGGLITPPGSPTNINNSAHLFVNFPDFHASPGAPTIDAGITSPANGVADLDGRARAQGASTDIGAFEVPVAGQGPGGAGSGTASAGLSADKTNPVASKLGVQPGAFAALSGRGSSLISAKRKPAKGATVRYRLSEAATLTFTVERVARGRKKKGRCVVGRRKGKACKRYKKVKGSFTHAGRAGSNSLRFSGRLARKPLRPGSYRLVGTARDAAGNKSKAVRTGFRIVRG